MPDVIPLCLWGPTNASQPHRRDRLTPINAGAPRRDGGGN
jgi:hypothetical protein